MFAHCRSCLQLGIAIYNKAKLDEKAAQAAIASVSQSLPLHTAYLKDPAALERASKLEHSKGKPVSSYTRQRLVSSASMENLQALPPLQTSPQGRRVPPVEQI